MDKSVSAVVVCAGSSARMGGIDKIFSAVNGVPVIILTLLACCRSKSITDIVIVSKHENFERIVELCVSYGITKPYVLVEGGPERAFSVKNGIVRSKCRYVAVMDGARPLVRAEDIDAVCAMAAEYGAAALGVPVTDTIKRVEESGNIIKTVDRTGLVRIQTPQVFERIEYIRLLEKALLTDMRFTDDCSVYEYFGRPVKMVRGREDNLKITVKEDLDICSRLCGMTSMRIGHGYDVHRLEKGRELWLCGEKIEFSLGLAGHSDADVAIHALIDAMLGAAAMGDIGKLFPDSDDKYKNISSIFLLKTAAEKVFEKYRFCNCDITIVAQKPKLSEHISDMVSNISKALQVPADRISVKATTEEKLGFTGSLEGISAHAVCLLEYKKQY